MHDAPQLPDNIDLFTAHVVDTVEAFGVPDVGKDRLDGAHAVGVALAPFGAVDFSLHLLAVRTGAFNADAESSFLGVLLQAVMA